MEQKACEEFIRREATEFDAVHPRFQKQDEEVIRKYEVEHLYYCEFCNQFFAPTRVGLKTHFSGDMVQHKPYAPCIYCTGPVYKYKHNNERRYYHNCLKNKE